MDKVQVEKLYIAGSRGSTLDASTVKFIDSLSVGVGGLNIHGFDEVNLSTVSSVGDVELSSFQSTRLINGIYTQGGDIVIEGSLLPTGAGGSVRHPVVLDTRLDNIGDVREAFGSTVERFMVFGQENTCGLSPPQRVSEDPSCSTQNLPTLHTWYQLAV